MILDDNDLNRDKFDDETKGQWKNEPLEAFACGECGQVFVGIPYCHELLVDADKLQARIPYNLHHGARCPSCNTKIQGSEAKTKELSLQELRRSAWG